MGLYDTVKREAIDCPTCGAKIKTFQTKSGFNQLLTVTEDELVADVKRLGYLGEYCPYYYGYCDVCHTRVDFEYVPARWEVSHETLAKRRGEPEKTPEEMAQLRKEYEEDWRKIMSGETETIMKQIYYPDEDKGLTQD